MDIFHFKNSNCFSERRDAFKDDASQRIHFAVTVKADLQEISDAWELGWYEQVARVDTLDPDTGFELTNHIDSNWLEHAEVKPSVEMARSSSVGDIFYASETYYIVAPCGFIEIPADGMPESPQQRLLRLCADVYRADDDAHQDFLNFLEDVERVWGQTITHDQSTFIFNNFDPEA